MESKCRKTDDKSSLHPQTERLIISDDGYFYRTREEGFIGPFSTESEALFDLNVFIEVTQIEESIQQDFQDLVA